jgi:hypothetical protein
MPLTGPRVGTCRKSWNLQIFISCCLCDDAMRLSRRASLVWATLVAFLSTAAAMCNFNDYNLPTSASASGFGCLPCRSCATMHLP